MALFNTGNFPQGGYQPPMQFGGYGGGDAGISSANNAMANIFGSLLGSQASNRATDAGLLGSGYNAQAGLLGKIFDAQNQNQASQFGSLANALASMYGSKSQANASLGNAAAGRDASMYGTQGQLFGQGLNSQAGVIDSLSRLQGNLAGVYGNLDAQDAQNRFEMQKLGAVAPLLGGLFGRFSGGGGASGLPSFKSSFGQSATWS